MSTIERRPDGASVVRTVCRGCEAPLTLPCIFDDGRTFEPDQFALKWADLVICNSCSAADEEKRSERDRRGEIAERVRQAQIPITFRGLRFEDLDTSGKRGSVISSAWAWADAPQGASAGLLVWGPPGTGKSRLAATAVWRRLQHQSVQWCSVAHLMASLSAAFNNRDRQLALSRLTGIGALVLDDLDKVPPNEHTLSQLFVAIDRRISAGSPLFVTANAAPAQLTRSFGSAIASRLLGYCKVAELSGHDRRLG